MYKKLIDIISNVDEDMAQTRLEIVQVLFKKFVSKEEKIPECKELWFEKDEIKNDTAYYQTIIKLLSIFIKYCSDFQSFKIEMFSKEIINLFKNSKIWNYFSNMLELANLFELDEEYYIEISCGLYCLGYKKNSPIHEDLIEILKDFTQTDEIKNSKFGALLKNMDYENIDESFMKNLSSLYNLILNGNNEAKIIQKIKEL